MAEVHVCIGCGVRDTSSRSMVCMECQRHQNTNAQDKRDNRPEEYVGTPSQDDKRRTLPGPPPEDEMEIDNE